MIADDCRRAAAGSDDRGRGDDGAGRPVALSVDSRPSAWPDNPVFRRFADAIMEEGERHGVPVLLTEGPLGETIAAAEGHFARWLALGPRAESVDERRALLREANEELVLQIRELEHPALGNRRSRVGHARLHLRMRRPGLPRGPRDPGHRIRAGRCARPRRDASLT